MKVIMPAESKSLNSEVCPSLGRAPYFLVYDIDNKKEEFVVNEAANSTGGAGVKAAQIIVDNKVDLIITPRCGENAAKVLKGADIKIYKSVNKTLGENIEDFNQGKISILESFHKGFHGGHQ